MNDGPEGPPPTFESGVHCRNLTHTFGRAGRTLTRAHVERGPMAQPDVPVPVALGYVAT